MTRDAFVQIVDEKLKLIRTEFGYSQDKMADILGISKKTIVQIEKGRSTLGWMGAVALCTIFCKSEIIVMTFGGQPIDIIMALAFDSTERQYSQTMGGKVWWTDVETSGGYRIQKNMVFQHYRILDGKDRRICSSFEYTHVKLRLKELTCHNSE